MLRAHGRFGGVWRPAMLAGALLVGWLLVAGPSGAADPPQNPIAAENALPGATSGWNEGDWGDDRLEAFADTVSTLPGGRVGLKVSTKPSGLAYELRVFRLGWYGGAGARLMVCLPDPNCSGSKPGITQPAPVMDSRGTVRASNWSETDSFAVGSDWVSGYYVVRLRLLDGSARTTVPLIVRAPANRERVILVQGSHSTWQAYNPWGGKSLYDERSQGGRAYAVSFDRPFDKNNWNVFDREVQLVRFLEREGYDVAYQTGMDTDSDPNSLVGYRVVVSAGHDEYWSKKQRDAFEAARDRGTSLMFLGANTAYWQVRYEDAGRTVVGYKSASLDPETDTSLDTTQFRALIPARPECQLLGIMYQSGTWSSADWGQWRTFTVASEALSASEPWFAATGFSGGATVPFIGHEWDALAPGCSHPAARVFFRYEGGTTRETAHATRYVAPSGARVFAAGTINWSWGLDGYRSPGAIPSAGADVRLQQFTRNVLADLLQPSAPVNYPPVAAATTSTPAPLTGQTVVLTDTSVDQDGSVVARAWDLDADGQYDDGTGTTASVSYASPGDRTVRLRVTDDDGAAATATLALQVTQASAYLGAVTTDGPSAYWRLGETTGTVAADVTGTVNGAYQNGVVLDQPGALVGDANRSVAFDGSNDTVKMNTATALNPTAALSIEAWIKPTAITATGMTVVRKTNQYELTVTSTGRLSLGLWKGGTRTQITSATNAIPTNAWSHIVGTWNGSTAAVYINGVQRGSLAYAGPVASGTSALYVGSSGGAASFFPGQSDEVAVYGTALTAARVDAHYNAAGDLSGPSVTLLSPAAGTTMNTTPNFGGRAGSATGDLGQITVDVYAGTTSTGNPIGSFTTVRHAGGSYSVVATPLAAGTYTARASQMDASGNTGYSVPVTFAVDPSFPATLLVAGDIAACDSAGDELTAPVLDRLAGTVQTTGDNAYMSGTTAEFDSCYDPTWGRHLARTRPGVGDHEYLTPGATGYFGYFGAAAGDPTKGYYSYDLGSWHIVVLNPQCAQVGGCGPGSPQEQWLRQDLAAHQTFCTAAIIDEPRFSSGRSRNEESDSLQVQPLWQALYDANADVVVSGDEHMYERFAPQRPDGTLDTVRGIREFVVGTGGAWNTDIVEVWPNSEVRDDETWGVLRLTLRSTGYDWTFERAAGETFTDSGSTSCHGAPVDVTAPLVTLTGPANGSSASDTTPVFAGAAGTVSGDLPTITVSVYAGSSVSGSLVQTRTATATGASWTVDASPALATGTYTVQASQTDTAGNTGLSSANTFTIAAYASTVLADNPSGYWRFGEASGSTAGNEIAGGLSGTYSQATLGSAGALANDSNTAAGLSGAAALVTIASHSAVDLGGGPFTIELWLKRSRTNQEEIVVAKGTGGYEVRIAKNGFVEFGQGGGKRIAISNVKISDTTTWHHLVVTRDGANAVIFVDAINVTGRVTPQTLSGTGAPLVFGAADGSGFNGWIDEAAVYGTALTAGRVLAHYQAGR